MSRRSTALLLGAMTLGAVPLAQAAVTAANLANYSLAASYALALPADRNEASSLTYNPVNGRLYSVEDEGSWVFELSTTGQLLSKMAMSNIPTDASGVKPDMEGIAYAGSNGSGHQFVVTHERLRDAYLFTYAPDGSFDFNTAPAVSLGSTVGNTGIEGISYDPVNHLYTFVKEISNTEVNTVAFDFTNPNPTVSPLLSQQQIDSLRAAVNNLTGGSNGLADLADLQVLAPSGGPPGQDRMLLLSQASKQLVEVTRDGSLLSLFNLAALGANIEGVAIDDNGNIYLVDEGVRTGDVTPGNPYRDAHMFVLSPNTTPVPLPAAAWLLLSGMGAIGAVARRRQRKTAT